MADFNENLIRLNETKQAIKKAIEDKGQDLSNVPFTEYNTKIADIRTSEDLTDVLTEQDEIITALEDVVEGTGGSNDYSTNVAYAKQMDSFNNILTGRELVERD